MLVAIWISILSLAAASCSNDAQMEESSSDVCDTIGAATMKPDGTIVLQLRLEDDTGIGDALYEIAPSDPDYQEILDHLGGLEPGQSKHVPAWPDEPVQE